MLWLPASNFHRLVRQLFPIPIPSAAFIPKDNGVILSANCLFCTYCEFVKPLSAKSAGLAVLTYSGLNVENFHVDHKR